MSIEINEIISYRDMCDVENVQTLQRGMNYRLNPSYSVVLMSQRSNAPYNDSINEETGEIEYEGHDFSKKYFQYPKLEDQPARLPTGILTENGKFIESIKLFKLGKRQPELVKVYEKVFAGVWSLKGIFDLIDYKIINDDKRNVFKFILRLSTEQRINVETSQKVIGHTRLIPSTVKMEVWKRDGGKCVICGDPKNLHYDHDLPYSKGGTSLTSKNVRLLCMKHNLQKSAKIE